MQAGDSFEFAINIREVNTGKLTVMTLAGKLHELQEKNGTQGKMTDVYHKEMIEKIKEAPKDYDGDYKIFYEHVQSGQMSKIQVNNLAEVLVGKYKPRQALASQAAAGLLALAAAVPMAQGGAGGAGPSDEITRLEARVGPAHSRVARAMARADELRGQLASVLHELHIAEAEKNAIDKALREAVTASMKRKRDQA